MKGSHRPLADIQQWMQAVITHPDGVAGGLRSEAARRVIEIPPDQLEAVIGRSVALDSAGRLSVYANAYLARLVECLEEEFPATRQAVGDETFATFAMGYLQTHPSTSYTLGQLGAKFPQHLRETRPTDIPEPGWPDFLIDLATLERLYADVFDGPGVEGAEPLRPERLRAIPSDRISEVVFHPAPCLRLIELRFPAHEYITAVRREQQPVIPEPSRTHLVVTRRDFVVRRGVVSETEFCLLNCLRHGLSLGAAIEATVARTDLDLETLVARLPGWFTHWSAAGWFIDFHL